MKLSYKENSLTKEYYLSMLENMLKIRCFEEKVKELSSQGLVGGAAHLYTGQEAIAVGACSGLNKDDYVLSTHRGHGHLIARGGDPNKMMAELLGKRTGYCQGKGGSMHIADINLGILGANGIVGGGLPISVGAGLSIKMQHDKKVVLCFFGDGAANQGAFHETLNLASLWRLPIVYICENNQYAVSTPVSDSLPIKNIADRAAGYGIPGISVDGNDILSVYNAVNEAVKRARDGKSPTLIECKTYRWEGHYAGDPCLYRQKDEVNEWKKKRDPIVLFKDWLVKEDLATQKEFTEIETSVHNLLDKAVTFAKESLYPDKKDVVKDVYVSLIDNKEENNQLKLSKNSREITYREAINEALREELLRDKRIFLVGEDIGLHGGAFQITKGLSDEFGGERIRNTPISESAIIGTAVGAAITGLRPVAEIMYIDFTTLCMDQIVNQAAKIRYMSGGKIRVPLVIRAPGGSGGRGNAAQHSQSLEAWFMHVPGLKVVMPSTPYDAKGLLKAAIRDDDPVIFIEHKVLYGFKGPVPSGEYIIPLGKADVKRWGRDITIIATSRMVQRALNASIELAKEDIEIEVIDPRTLVPLDIDTIIESIKKTSKALIVEEDCKTAGIGAEISARIMEHAFDYLDAPVKRLAGLDVPIPYSRVLEKASVPSEEDIIGAVREIL